MHPLSTLKAGDLLNSTVNWYYRVLSDVMYPELGELATVVLSCGDTVKSSNELKRYGDIWTLFELEEDGCYLVSDTTTTREEILSKLTQEERDIIEGKKI